MPRRRTWTRGCGVWQRRRCSIRLTMREIWHGRGSWGKAWSFEAGVLLSGVILAESAKKKKNWKCKTWILPVDVTKRVHCGFSAELLSKYNQQARQYDSESQHGPRLRSRKKNIHKLRYPRLQRPTCFENLASHHFAVWEVRLARKISSNVTSHPDSYEIIQ